MRRTTIIVVDRDGFLYHEGPYSQDIERIEAKQLAEVALGDTTRLRRLGMEGAGRQALVPVSGRVLVALCERAQSQSRYSAYLALVLGLWVGIALAVGLALATAVVR